MCSNNPPTTPMKAPSPHRDHAKTSTKMPSPSANWGARVMPHRSCPKLNLTRFHGVFAPGSKLRPFLLPRPPKRAPARGAPQLAWC
jgi:hypothetical protein